MSPKSFSGQEREAITLRLRQAAADCLKRYGVRRTTVDELVRLANIPKGTFYLFYPSKEELFFAVFLESHDALQRDFLARMAQAGPALGWRDLADAMLALCREAAGTFLLPLMTGGEMELILRKLPPQVVAAHLAEDDGSMEQMFAALPQLAGKDPQAYSAALRGIAMLYLHQREIGEEIFDDALKITVYGVFRQLFAEDTL